MALPRKPGLALVGSTIALGVLLASCAPGAIEGDEPTTEATPVESVDPADFAGETLSYVYFTDGPDEQGTRDLIAQFEDEYDVTVNLEVLAYADLVTSVQARLSGGNAPDVVRLTGLTDFRSDLLPLDGYLGEDYRDEFLPGPISATVDAQDQLVAVPSDLTLNAPFVNLDLFAQAGVEPPDPADPWTWEEMLAAGEQVREATGVPYAYALDKSGHRLSTVLSEYGTSLVGPDGSELDVDRATEALTPLVDMMAADTMPRDFWLGSGSKYQGANEIFLAGETPIYLSGNWQVAQFVQNATFEWAAAPNPCAEECGGFPGGKYMAALKESPNPALAAEFVRFMNTTESQETFLAAAGALPTRQDLFDAGVAYSPEAQPAMDVFLTDLERTPADRFDVNGHPAFAGSATELVNEVSAVVGGTKDLPTAMTDLRASVDDLVEETAP